MQHEQMYVFILGRYPEFSLQELKSVLNKFNIAYTIQSLTDTFVIIRTQHVLSIDAVNKTLGGTVKIGKILKGFPKEAGFKEILAYLTSDALFIDVLPDPEEKLTIGISYYSHEIPDARYKRVLPEIVKPFKEHLEEQGFTVRFPRHDAAHLSSASVDKNKLLTKGAEFLILRTNDQLWLGKTVAVQEFESFSKRDYGRPARDMESGIMPPKIARMMINLAEIDQDDKLIDPFCGSGTIIQEALLLNYKDITGVDISEKAVSDTIKNISWLKKDKSIEAHPVIELDDVTKLSERFGKSTFDAIVAEPYMGPNHQSTPQLHIMQQLKVELEKFYLKAWSEYAQVLKPGGTVVMILPVFHIHRQFLFMNILDDIAQLGFAQIPLREKKRKTLVIGNSYDFVLREIVKYKKEK